MSKKPLLNETVIRQFMKYANIEPLADNFINENYVEEEVNEEVVEEEEQLEEIAPSVSLEEAEHDMDAVDADMDVDELGDEEEPVAEEAPSEEELPPEAVDALEQAVEAAADAMLSALAPYGVEGEASIEGGEEADIDLEPAMDDMDDMDDMGDMGDEVPVDDMGLVDDGEDEPGRRPGKPGQKARPPTHIKVKEGEETLDEEDIVNETVKRVMARLSEMKAQAEAADKKDKMIESVTEAILARLNTKK